MSGGWRERLLTRPWGGRLGRRLRRLLVPSDPEERRTVVRDAVEELLSADRPEAEQRAWENLERLGEAGLAFDGRAARRLIDHAFADRANDTSRGSALLEAAGRLAALDGLADGSLAETVRRLWSERDALEAVRARRVFSCCQALARHPSAGPALIGAMSRARAAWAAGGRSGTLGEELDVIIEAFGGGFEADPAAAGAGGDEGPAPSFVGWDLSDPEVRRALAESDHERVQLRLLAHVTEDAPALFGVVARRHPGQAAYALGRWPDPLAGWLTRRDLAPLLGSPKPSVRQRALQFAGRLEGRTDGGCDRRGSLR